MFIFRDRNCSPFVSANILYDDYPSRQPELEGLALEHFQDADRSGKEISRRPAGPDGQDQKRSGWPDRPGRLLRRRQLHSNDLEVFRFKAGMTERRILVIDGCPAPGLATVLRVQEELRDAL